MGQHDLNSSRVTYPDLDLDSEANRRPFIFDAVKKEVGYENALNIATFKTEGSKSAILCSARGLGINSDEAQEIASLIPSERGFLWTLKDCFEGNEEKDRKPITQMINLIKQHTKLKETVMGIEGLISSRSSHACGFYIFQNGYIAQNALMKTPSGQLITQYDMDDSDLMGGLKVDFLTVKALDKIRKAMQLLLKDGHIKWQGSLRETYNKYFHPNAIDITDKDMWDNICEAKIMDLFQFETQVGSQAVRMLQPRNLKELSVGNSAMRLMPPEGSDETPLETFAKYKKDVSLWYKKAREWGLNEDEISILEKYLKESYMLAIEQEDIMKISMDEKISGFGLKEADKLRKAVAKKKADILKEVKDLFFQKGNKIGTRKVFLRFCWEEVIMLQAGYGFSQLHSVAYSTIGLQEAWIYTKYHRVYWNTACLTVNAEAGSEEVFDDTKTKVTNYGKIAKAIGDIQKRGITVLLPDINKSDYEFTPDSENDTIIYGLTPISGINGDMANDIISNRPYVSLEDFHKRLTVSKKSVVDSSGKEKSLSIVPSGKVITLIKSGAFDNICGDRIETMKKYINMIHPPKKKVNFQNFDGLIEMDLIPDELNLEVRVYKFYKFITNKKNIIEHDSQTKSKKWFNINQSDSINTMTELFFEENFIDEMKEGEDYRYENDGTLSIIAGATSCKFNKLVKEKYDNLTKWLKSEDCVSAYNSKMFEGYWNKYTDNSENLGKWEMSSVVFYYSEHELIDVNREKYSISNYFDLPEEPKIVGYNKYRKMEYPKYELTRICGTVIDKDSTKHIVSLLTLNGVVSVKYQSGQFSSYDKQVSYLDEDGKKVVIEGSWFSRGGKLVISGYRKGGRFVAKKYKDSLWSNSTMLIENVRENGDLGLKTERSKV
jgi:DNA polymerase-3 subunit alpha